MVKITVEVFRLPNGPSRAGDGNRTQRPNGHALAASFPAFYQFLPFGLALGW